MDENKVNPNNDEEVNEDDSIITLKDENGEDVKFEFLDLIEYNGDNYVVLLPAEETEDEASDEVVILKEDPSDETDEEESYVSVDDEEVLNKVFQIFKDKFKDEFNFVDE